MKAAAGRSRVSEVSPKIPRSRDFPVYRSSSRDSRSTSRALRRGDRWGVLETRPLTPCLFQDKRARSLKPGRPLRVPGCRISTGICPAPCFREDVPRLSISSPPKRGSSYARPPGSGSASGAENGRGYEMVPAKRRLPRSHAANSGRPAAGGRRCRGAQGLSPSAGPRRAVRHEVMPMAQLAL